MVLIQFYKNSSLTFMIVLLLFSFAPLGERNAEIIKLGNVKSVQKFDTKETKTNHDSGEDLIMIICDLCSIGSFECDLTVAIKKHFGNSSEPNYSARVKVSVSVLT